MKPVRLAALALLTVAPTAAACNMIGVAAAQAPQCGGNSTVHPAPIDCEGTLTISGIRGSVRLVVDETGYVFVTAVVQDLTPKTPLPPLFLQVKAHEGVSSDPGFVGGTDVFDGNTASLELTMPRTVGGSCTSQIDVKIAPGQPTLDHISPDFRVVAPLVGIDLSYCRPATTTTAAPTTVPETTVPETTVPDTTVPTTAPTSAPATSPTSPPASSGSTTAAPTASSVAGATIPTTGRGDSPLRLAIVLLFVGAFAIVVTSRRVRAS